MGDDYLVEAIPAENAEMTSAVVALSLYLEDHADQLLGIIRTYVIKARLEGSDSADVIAQEVMQETIIEALRHAEKFDPHRSPQAWLLGFANNIVKRKRVEFAQLQRREPAISQLNIDPETADALELFDKLAALNSQAFDEIALENPEIVLERQQTEAANYARLRWAWNRLSEEDRAILRLKMGTDSTTEEIARTLKKSTGAVRVSLHRAIARLSRIMSGAGGQR